MSDNNAAIIAAVEAATRAGDYESAAKMSALLKNDSLLDKASDAVGGLFSKAFSPSGEKEVEYLNSRQVPMEDIPELPAMYQGDPQSALGLYQRKDPTAKMSKDAQGNPVFEGEQGRFYPDSPKVNLRDIPQALSSTDRAIQTAAPGIAAGAVTAPAKLAHSLLTMGGTGLTSGTTSSLAEGEGMVDSLKQGGVEALIEMGGDAGGRLLFSAASKLAPIFKRMAGKEIKILDENGQMTDEAMSILEKIKGKPELRSAYEKEMAAMLESGDLSAEELARFQAFQRQGLTPTRAQVKRDATDFMEQEELAKNTGEVRSALEDQDKILLENIQGQIPASSKPGGAPALDPVQFSQRRVAEYDSFIDGLYADVRANLPDEKNIALGSVISRLREAAPDNELSGGVVKSIRGRLKEYGIDLGNNRGKISAEQAEKVRQHLNKIYSGANPNGKSIIYDLKEALDEDVLKYAGDDYFEAARSAKAQLEGGLNRNVNGRRDRRTGRGLTRDIIENKVDPDNLIPHLKKPSVRGSDVGEYVGWLKSQGQEGQVAYDNLRRSALDDIIENTFKGADGQNGVLKPSRANFEKALGKWEGKMEHLFTGPEMEFMDEMMTVLRYMESPPSRGVGRGPSAQGMRQSIEYLVSKIPAIGPIAVHMMRGGMADIAQEKAINNALNSLAKEYNEKNAAALSRAIYNGLMPSRGAVGLGIEDE